jgi:hypothetical protein
LINNIIIRKFLIRIQIKIQSDLIKFNNKRYI